MSSSSDVVFSYPEADRPSTRGPLERLWQSCSDFDTAFLSGEEVRRRVSDARSQGMQEIETRLRMEHERELSLLRCQVAEALAGFGRERQDFFRHMEKEVVRLAVSVARKVVGQALQIQPALLEPVVRDVLTRLEHEADIRLCVSPADRADWDKALAGNTNRQSFSLVSDDGLRPGQCTLHTPLGTTSIDPVSELAGIESAFLELAGSQPAECSTVQ